MSGRPWTEVELAILREEIANGTRERVRVLERLRAIGITDRTLNAVSCMMSQLRLQTQGASADVPETLYREIEYLRARNAELEAALRSEGGQGGKMTIRASDHHYGDAGHLVDSCEEAHSAVVDMIERVRPSEIAMVLGDDWIAGRGVFKSQEMRNILPKPEMQCRFGAIMFYDWISAIRAVSDAPVTVYWLIGNHDVSMGSSISEMAAETAARIVDLPDVTFVRGGVWTPVNIAPEGAEPHVVLMSHGFGYSNQTPHAPAFVNAAKNAIIQLSQKGIIVRRVSSGHTHWASTSIEYVLGVPFDSCGGWQRNERVKLGLAQRTPSLLVYRAVETTVLPPVSVTPSRRTLEQEFGLLPEELVAKNMRVAAGALERYARMDPRCQARVPGFVDEGEY